MHVYDAAWLIEIVVALPKDRPRCLFEVSVRLLQVFGRLKLLAHDHFEVGHVGCVLLKLVVFQVDICVRNLSLELTTLRWLLLLLVMLIWVTYRLRAIIRLLLNKSTVLRGGWLLILPVLLLLSRRSLVVRLVLLVWILVAWRRSSWSTGVRGRTLVIRWRAAVSTSFILLVLLRGRATRRGASLLTWVARVLRLLWRITTIVVVLTLPVTLVRLLLMTLIVIGIHLSDKTKYFERSNIIYCN